MYGIHMTCDVNYGGYFKFFGEGNYFVPDKEEYEILEFYRNEIEKLQIYDLPYILGDIIYIFTKNKVVYKFYVPYGDFFELLLWTYELPSIYRQGKFKEDLYFKSENFTD